MAVKAIQDLPLATTIDGTDSMIVEGSASTKRVVWNTVKTLIRSYLGLTSITGIEVVTALPASPAANKIYLIKES